MNCVSFSYATSFRYNLKMLFDYICNTVAKQTPANGAVTESNTNKAQTVSLAERAMNLYGNSILRLAYSYLHNISDAEDVLQDTLIKYMESFPVFKSDEHEKAWLLRVAANISKNKIDYNKIRESDELEENLAVYEDESLAFVWDAVKNLPDKYREVIHLYYQEGYKIKEISKILRRNESSIRSDLKRGRERLKNILQEAYDFE